MAVIRPGRPRWIASGPVASACKAAQIEDPALVAAIAHCRRVAATHSSSYSLATWLLAREQRPWVWALYGFFRTADEIVDGTSAVASPAHTRAALTGWTSRALASADGAGGATTGDDDPVLRALAATCARYPRCGTTTMPDLVRVFLESMQMDLDIGSYATYCDLRRYMRGSAEAVGLMMLPILGTAPGVDPETAQPYAARLGEAFQLTNFVRDVGEDLDRGRVYLPLEDLTRFGLTADDLSAHRDALRTGGPRSRGRAQAVERLLAFEVDRCLDLYRDAEPGIALLAPRARAGVRAAFLMYREIAHQIAAQGYPVLNRRVRAARHRRLELALRGYRATS